MIDNCYNCDVPHDACNRVKRTPEELAMGCFDFQSKSMPTPKPDPRDDELWALVDGITSAHRDEGHKLAALVLELNERRKVDNAESEALT